MISLFLSAAAAAATSDPADRGLAVCSAAAANVQSCVSAFGGVEGLATAASTALESCACCAGTQTVAAAYSSCSRHLSSAGAQASQYQPYGTLYSLCQTVSACGRGATASGSSAWATDAPSSVSARVTRSASITASGISDVAPACSSMFGLYQSCTSDIPGFQNMPFGEQAPCYCCVTARGQVVWTDEMDKYAQTCRDWAVTGGDAGNTVFSVASTFAGFCKRFSDACQATSTTLASNQASSTSAAARETGSAGTVTDGSRSTPASTTARPTTTTAGAAGLRVGAAAALAAAAVFLAVVM